MKQLEPTEVKVIEYQFRSGVGVGDAAKVTGHSLSTISKYYAVFRVGNLLQAQSNHTTTLDDERSEEE